VSLYLVHFTRRFGHAGHYLGYSDGHPVFRLQHHANGTGANLLRHVHNAGIGWHLTRVWTCGDRTLERRIKNNGSSEQVCPACRAIGGHRHRLPGDRWVGPARPDRICRWCPAPAVVARSWGRGQVQLCLEHAAAFTAAAYGASPADIAAGTVHPTTALLTGVAS
jgi:hypothetical protein